MMVLSALETFVTRLVQLLVTASRPTSFHLLLAGIDGSALERLLDEVGLGLVSVGGETSRVVQTFCSIV